MNFCSGDMLPRRQGNWGDLNWSSCKNRVQLQRIQDHSQSFVRSCDRHLYQETSGRISPMRLTVGVLGHVNGIFSAGRLPSLMLNEVNLTSTLTVSGSHCGTLTGSTVPATLREPSKASSTLNSARFCTLPASASMICVMPYNKWTMEQKLSEEYDGILMNHVNETEIAKPLQTYCFRLEFWAGNVTFSPRSIMAKRCSIQSWFNKWQLSLTTAEWLGFVSVKLLIQQFRASSVQLSPDSLLHSLWQAGRTPRMVPQRPLSAFAILTSSGWPGPVAWHATRFYFW